jgi:hypothetical protein
MALFESGAFLNPPVNDNFPYSIPHFRTDPKNGWFFMASA